MNILTLISHITVHKYLHEFDYFINCGYKHQAESLKWKKTSSTNAQPKTFYAKSILIRVILRAPTILIRNDYLLELKEP